MKMILKNTALTNIEINALTAHLKKIISNKTENNFLLNTEMGTLPNARPYNFKEPDKFSRAQLQTLNILFESFARETTSYLTNITNSGCEVDVVNVEQKSYHEIVRNMPDLTIINIFSFKDFDGQGIIEMSPDTLFSVLEKAFGGVGGANQKTRELTAIERRIQSTIVNTFLSIMNSSFENLASLNPKLEQVETNPQFIQQLTPPMEICVNIMLKIRISGYSNSGLVNITLPFTMLEPLCPKLNSHLWFVESKSNDSNSVFKDNLTSMIEDAPLEIRVEIGSVDLKFEDINSLKKDSIIILNKKKNEPFSVYLEDKLKFLGTAHVAEGKKVIKIDSLFESKN